MARRVKYAMKIPSKPIIVPRIPNAIAIAVSEETRIIVSQRS